MIKNVSMLNGLGDILYPLAPLPVENRVKGIISDFLEEVKKIGGYLENEPRCCSICRLRQFFEIFDNSLF